MMAESMAKKKQREKKKNKICPFFWLKIATDFVFLTAI